MCARHELCHPGSMQIRPHTTRLEFRWCNANVRIDVESNSSHRARRTILLMFYRKIEKQLEKASYVRLFHLDKPRWHGVAEINRVISLHQVPQGRTNTDLMGFEIRMRRLELGMTQTDLAVAAQISRSHISRIEKGHLKASSMTLRHLCKALDPNGKTALYRGLGALRKYT